MNKNWAVKKIKNMLILFKIQLIKGTFMKGKSWAINHLIRTDSKYNNWMNKIWLLFNPK